MSGTAPDEQALATRKRLRDDFEYWARTAYKIRTKSGELIPLDLNEGQRRILATIEKMIEAGRPVRIIILKGRQMGSSTMIEAYILWKITQRRMKRALVMAHVADSSSTLFTATKRGYDHLPPMLKPAIKHSNKRELVFGKLDSSLTVATAGGDGVGRGDTIQYVHLSEVGLWPIAAAEENYAGLMQALPEDPSSLGVVESTAKGMGNLFHRLWTEAVAGQSGFEPLFLSWTLMPEYVAPVPQGFQRTPEEQEIVESNGLSDGQLCFRRKKISEIGRDKFQEEYPLTAEEAFLTTGRPVFDSGAVYRMLEKAQSPLKQMALEDTGWEDHARGELSLWEPVRPDGTYWIGADVAEGVRGGDLSVAQVLNGKNEQVAVWRGLIYPDAFAKVLSNLGDYYNAATVCVELNNHGILTANVLSKELLYPHVWTDQQYDKIMDVETVRLGFTQNAKTRPMILNKLRAHVRDWTITIRDKTTLREMLAFIVAPNGKMEAEAGAHDDHVMSLAIAAHINEGEWEPIANLPEWYVESEDGSNTKRDT